MAYTQGIPWFLGFPLVMCSVWFTEQAADGKGADGTAYGAWQPVPLAPSPHPCHDVPTHPPVTGAHHMIDMTEADYADAYPDAEPTFAALCSRVRVYADIEVVIDDQGDLNVTQVWVVEGRDTHDYPSEAHWTFDTWREAMDAVPTFVLALSYFGMWDQVLGPLAAMGGW